MASQSLGFEPLRTEEDKEDDFKRRPTWARRTFGKMGQGSIRGSIFTLASTAMGAGFLAIPTCLSSSGIILGLILIIFSAFVMYLSHITIARAAMQYNTFHYSTITEKMLGKPAAVVLELAVILNGIGILIAYQIASECYAVGTFLPDVFKSIGIDFKDDRYVLMTLIAVVIVIPLGLFRHLAVLRYKALFNVTCLTYILLLVIFQFPYYSSQHGFDGIEYFRVDINFFGAFALCLFAYLCQQNLTRIEGELVARDKRRMNKVIYRAVFIQGGLFTMLALFGYLSFLRDTPELIIMRHAAKGIHHDWMMVLARFMESFTLTFAMPLNLSPTRASIEKLCFRFEGQSPLVVHVSITLICVFATLLCALFYPNISFVFNVLGGFCGAIMALLVPAGMFCVMSGKPVWHWLNLLILSIAVVLSGVAITSVFIGI